METNQSKIIRIIDSANSSIQIAVSWFTDEVILQKLIDRASTRRIEILVSADEMNLLRHTYFRALISKGAKVKKVGSSSPLDGDFMHSKFIIIDQVTAYGGSYNFTSNATRNYEQFREWATSELRYAQSDFTTWINKAKDFFYGVSNVEAILEQLKLKFMEQQVRNNNLLSSISHMSFSEPEYLKAREQEVISKPIIQTPISTNYSSPNQYHEKENSLRASAISLSSNITSVSTSAKVTSNPGVSSRPHSFHGGIEFMSIHQRKSNHHGLNVYQKHHISKTYDCFRTRIVNGTLICTGEIQPTNECEKYTVKIFYSPGLSPRVYIKSHAIEAKHEIHIYKEGHLCLFDPSETKWKDSYKVGEYTIPWVVEWILYYELWKLSGKWEGKASNHILG